MSIPSPDQDWRLIAERVKDYPLCRNCGEPYGNIAFGAAHFTQSYGGDCPGYQPQDAPLEIPK